jgi:hypothetical protein
MTKQKIIDKTLEAINQLPTDKAEEISDFADFVLKKSFRIAVPLVSCWRMKNYIQ